jgi:hypothetical protein
MSSSTRTTYRTSAPPRICNRLRRPKVIGADTERCFFCDGTDLTKQGKCYKKHETVQLWYCHTCDIVFTPQRTKGKTYPLKIILVGLIVAPRTFESWLAQYKSITYVRPREEGREIFTPHKLIRSVRLHHQQVYHYRRHNGKLALILDTAEHRDFAPIEAYLIEMATNCPHHLFQDGSRASKGREDFSLDAVEIKADARPACDQSRSPDRYEQLPPA